MQKQAKKVPKAHKLEAKKYKMTGRADLLAAKRLSPGLLTRLVKHDTPGRRQELARQETLLRARAGDVDANLQRLIAKRKLKKVKEAVDQPGSRYREHMQKAASAFFETLKQNS